jgi:type I restriction enzyme, S subunit
VRLAEKRPIKDYCLGIFDGPHATPKEADDGPIFLGIRNITEDGRLDLFEIRHVSEEEYPRWTRRVTPQAGDLVFTYEASLHRYAVIPEGFRGCLGRRVALVRPDPEQVYSRYLLYFFLSQGWRQVVESNIITGATVDRVPLEKFPSFPMALPRLHIQHRIADILSNYDDLIENNRRRMALLEDAVRQLYREWFVRLRFPGHEHTRITDGEPDGWEKVKVGSLLLKVSRAKRIKKDDYAIEGTIPCVDQGSNFIGGYTDDPDALIEQPLPLIVFGDHTRVLKFVNFPFACGADGTQLIYPNTTRVSPEYLYFALKAVELSNYFYARHFKFLKELEVFIPRTSLVREFTNIVAPCFEQIKLLRTQNEKLRAARDLLLPRLMSGEITV